MGHAPRWSGQPGRQDGPLPAMSRHPARSCGAVRDLVPRAVRVACFPQPSGGLVMESWLTRRDALPADRKTDQAEQARDPVRVHARISAAKRFRVLPAAGLGACRSSQPALRPVSDSSAVSPPAG